MLTGLFTNWFRGNPNGPTEPTTAQQISANANQIVRDLQEFNPTPQGMLIPLSTQPQEPSTWGIDIVGGMFDVVFSGAVQLNTIHTDSINRSGTYETWQSFYYGVNHEYGTPGEGWLSDYIYGLGFPGWYFYHIPTITPYTTNISTQFYITGTPQQFQVNKIITVLGRVVGIHTDITEHIQFNVTMNPEQGVSWEVQFNVAHVGRFGTSVYDAVVRHYGDYVTADYTVAMTSGNNWEITEQNVQNIIVRENTFVIGSDDFGYFRSLQDGTLDILFAFEVANTINERMANIGREITAPQSVSLNGHLLGLIRMGLLEGMRLFYNDFR